MFLMGYIIIIVGTMVGFAINIRDTENTVPPPLYFALGAVTALFAALFLVR